MEKIVKVDFADYVLLENIRQYLYTYTIKDKKIEKDLQNIFDYLDNKIYKDFYKEHRDFNDMQLLIKTTFQETKKERG